MEKWVRATAMATMRRLPKDSMTYHVHQPAGLPQLKEISFKKAITLGGGVNINCIYYTIFSKVLCLTCFQIPTPYKGSPMQISCGSPANQPVFYKSTKKIVFACCVSI